MMAGGIAGFEGDLVGALHDGNAVGIERVAQDIPRPRDAECEEALQPIQMPLEGRSLERLPCRYQLPDARLKEVME